MIKMQHGYTYGSTTYQTIDDCKQAAVNSYLKSIPEYTKTTETKCTANITGKIRKSEVNKNGITCGRFVIKTS